MERINKLIHKIPSVSTCCFCVDLRTAGLIIGSLRLVGFTLLLFKVISWRMLLIILLDVCWIYGILKEKPIFMLPTILTLVVALFEISLLLFILAAFLMAEATVPIIFLILLALAPFLAFIIHVMLVQVSLYKTMTEQPPPSIEANAHSVEYKPEMAQDEKLVLDCRHS
ncbi:uncharacterized protein LOC129570314 isoform X2 [Sitodiplosis mosellana]|nr:uncharacterized protein LOC129570314 isoform X2 [Sitodiplosis mosellana]